MDYAAKIERLRSQMLPPKHAGELLLIERNVSGLKGERAGVIEMLRLAQAEDSKDGLTQPSANTRNLSQRVKELDGSINTARRELAKARDTHSDDLTNALQPTAAAYVELLHEIVDALDRAAGLGVEIANYATRNGLTCDAPHVRKALIVSALVRDIRLGASGAVR
jgi:hypothetical protein